jgi:hypothetical protein
VNIPPFVTLYILLYGGEFIYAACDYFVAVSHIIQGIAGQARNDEQWVLNSYDN